MADKVGSNIRRLKYDFFNKSSYDLAKGLLGKLIVHNVGGKLLKCRIVETELYPGGTDKGSVSYNGRRTPAIEAIYMDPGTTYVYLTYGMYHCINISSADEGGAVLIRAGEPINEIDEMHSLRINKLKQKKNLKVNELCNGPSKFCIAMNISKTECNMLNMSTSEQLWIESDDFIVHDKDIVLAKRIGIDRAGTEAINQLYRFYLYNNSHVSKRDFDMEATNSKQN